MADSVGKIQLDLGINSKGFNSDLNNISKTAKSASGKISGSLAKIGAAAVAAFSVKAILKFGKECLELGSDLAEVQNVVDVTFGSMSDKVNEFAKNAITSYGLSEKVAKEYMGQFGAMSKAFDNGTAAAYEQAEALTALTGDVASFYNLSTDEAFTKLKAVYTGETESLKSLGVVMTQTALDQFALSKGYGKTTSAMSEQEKVALRLAFVQDKLAAASGDFIRTSDGWANQTRVLSLRFDALKASLGQGLINVLTPVIKLLNGLMAKLQILADRFSNLTAAIFGNAGGASAAEALSQGASDLSDGLASGASSAKGIKKSLAGFDEINVLSNDSGEAGSSGGSSVIADAGSAEMTNNLNTANGFAEKLKTVFDDIKNKIIAITKITGLNTLWNKVKLSIDNVKIGVGNLFDSLKNAILENAPNIAAFGESLKNAFTTISQTITTILGDMWLSCTEHFKIFNTENSEAIQEFFSNIIEIYTAFGTLISDITADIYGGILDWWEKGGKRIWDEILSCIDDIKKWLLDIWNNCIAPLVQNLIAEVQRLWDNHLKPLWDKLLNFFTSVWDFIKMLWDQILKPAVDWIVKYVGPAISDVLSVIGNVFGDLFGVISDVIGGILDALGGALDFLTGVFTGNWKKAWSGIKKYVEGIWYGMWGVIKGVINLIIDGLNLLWSGLYAAIRAIVNTLGDGIKAIGKLFGQDDWGWEMPANAPKIPRLAAGGYVEANTPRLAIIGDNKREGEIVAPESKIAEAVAAGVAMVLSKLQQPQSSGTHQPIVIKIGETDVWQGFIDFHNSQVMRTGESPLLI